MIIKFILIYLLFFLDVLLFLKVRRTYKCILASKKNFSSISSLGYAILCCGKKGVGKSSFLNALSYCDVKYMIKKQINSLNKIKLELFDIDFNLINEYIEKSVNSLLSFQPIPDYSLIDRVKLKKRFKLFLSKQIHNKFFHYYSFDYFSLKNRMNLLLDYMITYTNVYFPGDYMIANYYRYNHIHKRHAKYFDDEGIQILNNLKDKKYIAISPCTITYDEASHFNGNVESNSKEKKLSGSTHFLSLLRNAGNELIYFRCAVQNPSDFMKNNREQLDCVILLHHFNKISCFDVTIKFFDLIAKIYKFFNSIPLRIKYLFNPKKFSIKSEAVFNQTGTRKFLHKIKSINDYLFALGYVHVYAYYSSSVDELKKENLQKIDFIFPITEFFCGNSHQYKYLFEMLEDEYSSNSVKAYSTINDSKVIVNNYIKKVSNL